MTTLRTSVKESPVCIKNPYHSFKVHLYWLLHRCSEGCCGCNMNWTAASWVALCNFNTMSKTSHNHCLSSLSATRVTTLWLKQPTCFCSVRACMHVLRVVSVLWLWNELGSCLLDCMHYAISLQYQSNLSQPQSLLASFPGSPLTWEWG